MPPDIEILDLREDPGGEILSAVYRGLYQQCIPRPEEQEPEQRYRDWLYTPQSPPKPYLIFLVCGRHLRDAARREIAGFIVIELYRRSRTALLAYVGVASHWRRQRIGRQLFDASISRAQAYFRSREDSAAKLDATSTHGHPEQTLEAVFAEIHFASGASDSAEPMPTNERIEVFRQFGGGVLPFKYFQPALSSGQPFSDELMLVVLPSNYCSSDANIGTPSGSFLQTDCNTLFNFLIEYYCASGVAHPEALPEFQEMLKSIEHGVQGKRPLHLEAVVRAGLMPLGRITS